MSEPVTAQKSLTELLPADAISEIDRCIAKYPPEQKRSAVMSGLMVAQENNAGYLSEELMDAVADYLEIPHMAAYEVATFYTMYNLEPVGEHVINVCTNISCMLRGSKEIVEHLNERLDVRFGETTRDNKFTLVEVECQGACAGAPMCEIDKIYHENLTVKKIDKIIDFILKKNLKINKEEG